MDTVQEFCERIIRRFHPQKVLLFSRKLDLTGALSAFKICVVAQVADEQKALAEIYLQEDCPIPFDVVIYTPRRWEELRLLDGSFAQRIDRTGRVLYAR